MRRRLVYVVYGVIVIVLAFFVVLSVVDSSNSTVTKKTPISKSKHATVGLSVNKSGTNKIKAGNNSSANKSSSKAAAGTAANSSTSTASSTTPSSAKSKLNNTGPGNDLAVFITFSVVAYLISITFRLIRS